MTLDARRVFFWHIVVIACLAAAHLIVTIVLRDNPVLGHDKVQALFDLDSEAGPGAFFSSLALLACAGMTALISRDAADPPIRRFWTLCAFLAAYLSLDEAIGIHEKFSVIAHLVTSGRGIFTIGWWVIYPFVLAPFLAIGLPGLFRLDPATRHRLVLAGLVFVSGAVGFEIVESLSRDAFVTIFHLRHGNEIDWSAYGAALSTHGASFQREQHGLVLFEETLEMTGVALALRALLIHAAALGSAMAVRVITSETIAQTVVSADRPSPSQQT